MDFYLSKAMNYQNFVDYEPIRKCIMKHFTSLSPFDTKTFAHLII